MTSAYRDVLRSRDYALVWVGQTTSQLGDSFYEIALVWLALHLGAAGFSGAGVVIFARLVPYILIGPLSGVYVDRWDRKRTMIVCDTLRGLVVMAVPLLALLGALALWHLAAVAFLLTTLRTFFNPALQASVPRIVAEERLVTANGLLQASIQAATIVGPAIAGVILVATSPDVLFLLDGLTFFVSALSIVFVGLARAQPPAPRTTADKDAGTAAKAPGALADIASTVRLIRGQRLVFWNMVLFGAGLFSVAGAYRLGTPALAEEVLGGGSATYGLLVSSIGVGTVGGALLVGRLGSKRYSPLIFAGWLLWGAFFALLGLSGALVLSLALAVLAGVAESVVTVLMVSLLQSSMPPERLGRVFSLWSVLCSTGESSGSLLTGYLLDAWTAAAVFVASGLAAGAVGLFGLFQVARSARAPAAAVPLPAGGDPAGRVQE